VGARALHRARDLRDARVGLVRARVLRRRLAAGCKGDDGPAVGSAAPGSAAGSAGSAAGSAGSPAGSGALAEDDAAPARRASCDAIDTGIVGNLTPPDLRPHLTPPIELRLRTALIAACRRDRWSAEALDCAARTPASARDRCPGKLTAAQARSAESALIVEALTAIAEPIASATPPSQHGPHPDYPTAALAGTDKLFTMIEPARGPKAPIGMTIPRGLTWTTHEHCTADITGPVCSPAVTAAAGLWSWRIGKRGAAIVVAEERRGARVDRTFVYLLSPGGTPRQRVRFDAYGRVESALLFQGGEI
jgi:hypothetical protein